MTDRRTLPLCLSALLLLAAALAGAADPPAATERAALLTARARLLAGLPVTGDGPWVSLQEGADWQAHAKALGRLWAQHEKERLSKVRAWAAANLSAYREGSTAVFYPFSGPDMLYPLALFPKAPVYVLAGLEEVGLPPEVESLSAARLASDLKGMRENLSIVLQVSFFRTNDMALELKESGVTPVLMVLLAGSGCRILDVRPIALDDAGTPGFTLWTAGPRAVRIDFQGSDGGAAQTLYYFKQDLSDAGLKGKPALGAFVGTLGRPVTFLKAASYLMHEAWFSTIRTLILERSRAVLEDDAGIPLKAFDAAHWRVTLFGTYAGPVPKFHQFLQKDLLEAYRAGTPAPLDFGIGYQHRAGKSNLLLAVRTGE